MACGSVLPGVRSLYRWQGKVADEQEVVVLLKTRSARLETLKLAFEELHPYKVPELLALPVTAEREVPGMDQRRDDARAHLTSRHPTQIAGDVECCTP